MWELEPITMQDAGDLIPVFSRPDSECALLLISIHTIRSASSNFRTLKRADLGADHGFVSLPNTRPSSLMSTHRVHSAVLARKLDLVELDSNFCLN